ALRMARRLVGFLLLAGGLAARPAAAQAGPAHNPKPDALIYTLYLPYVTRPILLNLPLVLPAPREPPSNSFLGTNGSNIDAVNGTTGPDGMLAYFPLLRDKSMYWTAQ